MYKRIENSREIPVGMWYNFIRRKKDDGGWREATP